MDIRIMQYFLAITREGNISAAAEALHVSQPSLSRQMKELEEELGVTLFERGNRRITLTEEGLVLRKRAEEIMRLMQLTEDEIANVHENIAGDVYVGSGESRLFHYLSRAAAKMQVSMPGIHFHVVSGDTHDLLHQLDSGLLDFALLFTDFDRDIYQSILLPEKDRFGVLMRKDDPLAAKETLSLKDLYGRPLAVSRAARDILFDSETESKLDIIGTYNLITNATYMVEDGMGLAFSFDGLVNVTGDSPLTLRPFKKDLLTSGTIANLVWRRYETMTPAASLFLQQLQEDLGLSEEP